MDTFAYVSLGACGALLLLWLGAWLWALLSSSLGRAILVMVALWALLLCGVVSTVWLIGTKLI